MHFLLGLEGANGRFQLHHFHDFGIAGSKGLHLGIGQYLIAYVLNFAGRGSGGHNLVDGFGLSLEGLPHVGIETAFGEITIYLHFWIFIALADDTTIALFNIGGSPRRVQMMSREQFSLYIGPHPHFAGGSQEHANCSLPRLSIQRFCLFLIFGIVDKGNLGGGNTVFYQFGFYVIINIEPLAARGR